MQKLYPLRSRFFVLFDKYNIRKEIIYVCKGNKIRFVSIAVVPNALAKKLNNNQTKSAELSIQNNFIHDEWHYVCFFFSKINYFVHRFRMSP